MLFGMSPIIRVSYNSSVLHRAFHRMIGLMLYYYRFQRRAFGTGSGERVSNYHVDIRYNEKRT